jgi:hypothetical protein
MNIPTNRRIMNDEEISTFVYGRFFRCIVPFLSWLKVGESYWLEYHGNDNYEVRSDNALGQKFSMTTFQLLTCFFPVECEKDIYSAFKYFHWLGENEIHHGRIDDIVEFYRKNSELLEEL